MRPVWSQRTSSVSKLFPRRVNEDKRSGRTRTKQRFTADDYLLMKRRQDDTAVHQTLRSSETRSGSRCLLRIFTANRRRTRSRPTFAPIGHLSEHLKTEKSQTFPSDNAGMILLIGILHKLLRFLPT